MLKVVLYKSLNVRSGEVPLRFRVREGKEVDLTYDTGKMVSAQDLMAFNQDGSVQDGVTSFNAALQREIVRFLALVNEAYMDLRQESPKVPEEQFRLHVEELLKKEAQLEGSVDGKSVAARFRMYIEEEHDCGHHSDKRHRDGLALAGKLERYLLVRECPGILPQDFTAEMVVDFEKFCVEEYLYAWNPKYASIYPRSYEGAGRNWPKKLLQEESIRKMMLIFREFWQDLVNFGEIEASPYDGYVEWMQPKKYKRYAEVIGDPLTLTMDEFQKVLHTPVPESLGPTRNAFIVHCCLGCRGEDMKKLTLANLHVSEEGIPYIYYRHDNPRRKGFHSEIRVPIVRIAYDILMRTHFEYFYGCYNAPYNRLIQKLLRFCGIDRKVLLYNSRTGVSEEVPICEAFNQGNIHPTHMDILHDMESMRGLRGPTFTGQRTLEQMNELPIEEHFRRLNLAFGQKSYRVDENLNIIDGAPFEPRDPMIYKEVPEKKFKGGTVPYIIEEIHAMAPGEAEPEDRIEVRYHQHLLKERPLLLCGDQFPAYLAGMDSKRQRKVQYGLLLLRRLGSFDVPFVKKEKGTIYSLRTELRGCTDATYFYINAGTIVILQGHRLEKANGKIKPPKMEELEMMRWAHVIGQTTATDYGAVLDGILGAPGTKAREKSWAGACSNFVNQALIAFRRVARHQDYTDPIKDEVGAISNVGHRERTLPYRYLRRILKALNCRVVITRMVSDEEIENLRRRPTAEVE